LVEDADDRVEQIRCCQGAPAAIRAAVIVAPICVGPGDAAPFTGAASGIGRKGECAVVQELVDERR
jgi:hypothetical protein